MKTNLAQFFSPSFVGMRNAGSDPDAMMVFSPDVTLANPAKSRIIITDAFVELPKIGRKFVI